MNTSDPAYKAALPIIKDIRSQMKSIVPSKYKHTHGGISNSHYTEPRVGGATTKYFGIKYDLSKDKSVINKILKMTKSIEQEYDCKVITTISNKRYIYIRFTVKLNNI